MKVNWHLISAFNDRRALLPIAVVRSAQLHPGVTSGAELRWSVCLGSAPPSAPRPRGRQRSPLIRALFLFRPGSRDGFALREVRQFAVGFVYRVVGKKKKKKKIEAYVRGSRFTFSMRFLGAIGKRTGSVFREEKAGRADARESDAVKE